MCINTAPCLYFLNLSLRRSRHSGVNMVTNRKQCQEGGTKTVPTAVSELEKADSAAPCRVFVNRRTDLDTLVFQTVTDYDQKDGLFTLGLFAAIDKNNPMKMPSTVSKKKFILSAPHVHHMDKHDRRSVCVCDAYYCSNHV